MDRLLLAVMASLPVAQVLIGWAVLHERPAACSEIGAAPAPVMVDTETLRAMALREERRSAVVRRAQPERLDPLRRNRRRSAVARDEGRALGIDWSAAAPLAEIERALIAAGWRVRLVQSVGLAALALVERP